MVGLIATKEGMTRIFHESGESIPVSVLKVDSNFVSQIKNSENDLQNLIKDIFKNQNKLISTSKKLRSLSDKLSNLRKRKTPSDFLSDLILEMTEDLNKEMKILC